jgi:hypothetical protein
MRHPRFVALASPLLVIVGIVGLLADVQQTAATAACLARAEFEMILCIEPAPSWAIQLRLLLIAGAASLFGYSIKALRDRHARRQG